MPSGHGGSGAFTLRGRRSRLGGCAKRAPGRGERARPADPRERGLPPARRSATASPPRRSWALRCRQASGTTAWAGGRALHRDARARSRLDGARARRRSAGGSRPPGVSIWSSASWRRTSMRPVMRGRSTEWASGSPPGGRRRAGGAAGSAGAGRHAVAREVRPASPSRMARLPIASVCKGTDRLSTLTIRACATARAPTRCRRRPGRQFLDAPVARVPSRGTRWYHAC